MKNNLKNLFLNKFFKNFERNTFFLISSVWFLDFLTTIFGLFMCDNIVETNNFANFFLMRGFFMILIYYLIAIISFVLLTKIYSFTFKQLKKLNKEEIAKKIILSLIFLLFFLELYCVINNLIVIGGIL